MPQVFLLKKAQLPNASCASYVISDADLPQNLSEVEIKLSGQDEKKLRGGVSSTADAPTIAILLGRDGEAYSIDEPYLKAVFSCGAKVKLIHYFHPAEQLKEVDGLLLPGGCFPTPKEWYTAPSADDSAPNARTMAYLELIDAAFAKKLPLLGICGGMQMLAGKCGAKLLRKVAPSDVEHRSIPANSYAHDIRLASNSLLSVLNGGSLNAKVNSRHSEAVAEVPDDKLRISAKAADGVIEAIELKNYSGFALGVQWHPERMVLQNEKFASAIFQRLCDEAKSFKKKK